MFALKLALLALATIGALALIANGGPSGCVRPVGTMPATFYGACAATQPETQSRP